MATQKELVAVVAENMGVPLETVTVIDRFLAEAGLRTRALRGRGHTPMTYRDAANLVMAVALDGGRPKGSVQQAKAYGGLSATRVKESAFIAEDSLGSTFGEALANMIESVAESRVEFSAPEGTENHMAARVTMHGPTPRAEIMLVRAEQATTFEFGSRIGEPGDLVRSVQFSQITLGFVGEAIADDLSR